MGSKDWGRCDLTNYGFCHKIRAKGYSQIDHLPRYAGIQIQQMPVFLEGHVFKPVRGVDCNWVSHPCK